MTYSSLLSFSLCSALPLRPDILTLHSSIFPAPYSDVVWDQEIQSIVVSEHSVSGQGLHDGINHDSAS